MSLLKAIALFRNPLALIEAIKENPNSITAAEVKDWLESGAKVNLHDFGNTALILACGQGASFTVVKALLDAGADINAQDWDKRTALILAIENERSFDVIELLINEGADVDLRDCHNDTALIWATYKKAPLEVVELLLAKGADINNQGWKKEPALTWAVEKNASNEVMTALCDAGADPNLIQDLVIRQKAIKFEQKRGLQKFLCAQETVLKFLDPQYSSLVTGSAVAVTIGKFLGADEESIKHHVALKLGGQKP